MRNLFKRLSIAVVLVFVSVSAIIIFTPKVPLLSGIPFSKAVYDSQGHLLRLTLSADEKYRLFTPLKQISPQLISATLLQEDQYFRWHFGINPISLAKAAWQTYVIKSRRIGASTITMQVARLRYRIHSKTLLGKISQILRTLQLEFFYSKDEILEAYLNLAPYGNNIEGVGAASLVYFGRPVKTISLPQALTLSVIPQNPIRRTPQEKNLKAIRNKLFIRWIKLHPEDKNQQATINLPLQMQNLHDLPFLAPHFVNLMLASSHQYDINTTLDLRMQKIIERVSRNYLSRKKNIGVQNAAVMLVDTRDMSVKAMMGSASFFEGAIGGQINGTEIQRSPGSTLKPFIYGLALDQGLIHPNTVLKDVPKSFGSYNPENFDYDFVGPIKAKDALVLSRNIPAIYLADQLKQPNLYELLQAAHVKNLKPPSFYGLALVLGGAEVSMHELVSLYAMLENNGVWHPLRMRLEDPADESERLLSPEASFLVLDMLQDTSRIEPSWSPPGIKIAWKTGTSSGFRDAWTVGVFGPYVVAVWLGNFDNKSNPALVGKEIAAPLMFEIAGAISRQVDVPAYVKIPTRLHLTQVEVCKASGMLPTRYCTDTETTWFIPGKSPIKTDTIFREVAINNITGKRTCHFDKNTRFEIEEFWPSDLLKVFRQAGVQRRTPPAYESDCLVEQMIASGMFPQITSPQTQLSYIIRPSLGQKTRIPLTATADADVQYLYWFMNESFIAKTPRDQTLFWEARPGKFIVRVVDDHGRGDARDINVKAL